MKTSISQRGQVLLFFAALIGVVALIAAGTFFLSDHWYQESLRVVVDVPADVCVIAGQPQVVSMTRTANSHEFQISYIRTDGALVMRVYDSMGVFQGEVVAKGELCPK